MKQFIIRGNVPSLKNTKLHTMHGPVTSKTVRKWQVISKPDWEMYRDEFKALIRPLPRPYFVHLTFTKTTDVLWDFTAPTETVMDEMVKYGWLNDDNHYEVCPVYGKPLIDRKNPITIIRVLAEPPLYRFL